jgi:hypothetical protein
VGMGAGRKNQGRAQTHANPCAGDSQAIAGREPCHGNQSESMVYMPSKTALVTSNSVAIPMTPLPWRSDALTPAS